MQGGTEQVQVHRQADLIHVVDPLHVLDQEEDGGTHMCQRTVHIPLQVQVTLNGLRMLHLFVDGLPFALDVLQTAN